MQTPRKVSRFSTGPFLLVLFISGCMTGGPSKSPDQVVSAPETAPAKGHTGTRAPCETRAPLNSDAADVARFVPHYIEVWKGVVATLSNLPKDFVEARLRDPVGEIEIDTDGRWLKLRFTYQVDWVSIAMENRIPVYAARSPLFGAYPLLPREQYLTEPQIVSLVRTGSPLMGMVIVVPKTVRLKYGARKIADRAFFSSFGVGSRGIRLRDGDLEMWWDRWGNRGAERQPCGTKSMSLLTGKTQTTPHPCWVSD